MGGSRKTKRVGIFSDSHCGHLVGLTSPQYQMTYTKQRGTWRDKAADLERESWNWFEKETNATGPFDVVIFNADMIDGRGERSGGTELITTNRITQVDMALDVLKQLKAKHYVLTYGTPYHTGDKEDFEDIIADRLRDVKGVKSVKIGSHEWVDVNGCVFDVKHHIGSSQIPHGRYTALARDRLWNCLWSDHKEQPKGDVIIRSHVHYHVFCGEDDVLAMTTPALQAMGTKFGARKCSGRVNYGFVHFDVNPDGGYVWQAHLADLKRQKARTVKL